MVRNIVFVNFKHWSINKNWLVCLAVFLFIFSRFFFLSYCKFFASLICMERHCFGIASAKKQKQQQRDLMELPKIELEWVPVSWL